MLDAALPAAGAIWRFWQLRGHFAEARSIFEGLLAQPGAAAGARAKALIGAGGIAYWQGDFEAMARHYREARELYESAGDPDGMAEALYNESYVPLLLQGDLDRARALLERALELYRQSGNELGAAEAELMLGFSHYFEGEPQAAIPFQERAIEAYRAAGAQWQLSENLMGLSGLYAQTGDWTRSVTLLRESLALASEMGVEVGLAMAFDWVGASAVWVGELELGSRLLGKADEMKARLGGAAPSQLVQTEAQRAQAREQLGEERYEQLRSEGGRLGTTDAFALAMEFEPPPDADPMPRFRAWGMAAQGEGAGAASD
jgi:tetratricopeptide (TPR) repeat protein